MVVLARLFLLLANFLTPLLLCFPVYANHALNYSGPFTNTTFSTNGTVKIYLSIGTDNTVSGYIDFTGDSFCGAGDITGSKQGNSVEFGFTSRDPDVGCGFDWGSAFTVTGILSENGQAFEGQYRINNGQQGILRATATPTISAPPPPLIGRLTLPAKPPSESDALIVVLHGCCTPPGSNIKIWQDMANKLQGPGRPVWLYSWQED